ncbi:unnamed protein product [Bursaphelenchus okinawaensis]|uniref:UDENN FNIP1/2-type domain-containing protein n=1 Tax=Bursaphelenchus okinawaensis TaxID=465554 RepID=A0A811KT68_9BILA|nr:unnamed protein product [Bursaphelenchus okinawaensis]CAG9110568.1 unnamed protein product [Bursaphelenchus okinawaensis]
MTISHRDDYIDDFSVGQSQKIRRSDIRLIVFNENNQRLLYDSDTVIAIEDRLLQGRPHTSPCGRFQYLRHRSDVPQIGRMIFGTLPTSSKTGSLKIHTLPHSNSVMLSRVFFVPKAANLSVPYNELKFVNNSFGSDADCQSQHYATIRSLDTLRDDVRRKNSSADPPKKFRRIRNSSLQLDSDDAILEEVRAFSPNRLSRHRRKQLSLKGLADEGPAIRWGSRSRMSSCSSINDGEEMKQIGFALVFDAKERDFIFQHILQIEKEIIKLEFGIYKASNTRSQFFYCVYQAYRQFADAICLLYNSLRLRQPVWLSLLDSSQQSETAERFCNSLAGLIEQLDKKETHYFLSRLLSSVLMNHLAWVASVAPPDTLPQHERSLLLGTSVIDASRQPYNARLAQLMELCGIVGGGEKLAKTVIIGKNPRLISEILFVLSYFIRCSNVECRRSEVLSPVQVPSQPVNIASSPSNPHSDYNDDFLNDLSSSNASQQPTSAEAAPTIPIHQPVSTRSKRPSSSLSSQYATSPLDALKFTTDEPPVKTRAINLGSYHPGRYHPDCSYQPDLASPTSIRIHSQTIVYSSSQAESSENLRNLPSPARSRMKLTLDVEDVQISGQELAPSIYNNALQQQSQPINIPNGGHSPASSSHSSQSLSSNTNASGDLGRSLLAGVCSSYSPHFVLSGVDLRQSDIEDTFNAIYEDVKHPTGEPCESILSPSSSTSSALTNSAQDLPPRPSRQPRQNSMVADSPRGSQKSACFDGPTSAVVVVGDLTDMTVRTVAAQNCKVDDRPIASPSDAVVEMLEQFISLHKLRTNSNFLISFLEDRLSTILSKSQTLVKLITTGDRSDIWATEPTPTQNLSHSFGSGHGSRSSSYEPMNLGQSGTGMDGSFGTGRSAEGHTGAGISQHGTGRAAEGRFDTVRGLEAYQTSGYMASEAQTNTVLSSESQFGSRMNAKFPVESEDQPDPMNSSTTMPSGAYTAIGISSGAYTGNVMPSGTHTGNIPSGGYTANVMKSEAQTATILPSEAHPSTVTPSEAQKEHQFRAPNPPASFTMSKLRNLSVVSVKSPAREQRRWLSQDTIDEDPDDRLTAASPMILTMERVCEVVGCDCSDLRLIVNVAAIYQPNVLSSLVM